MNGLQNIFPEIVKHIISFLDEKNELSINKILKLQAHHFHALAQSCKIYCELLAPRLQFLRAQYCTNIAGFEKLSLHNFLSEKSTCLQLMYATNEIEALKMLIKNDFDVNQKCLKSGRTLLHLAVANKDIEIIRYLVNHPYIDTKIKTKTNKTADEIASSDEIRHLLRVR